MLLDQVPEEFEGAMRRRCRRGKSFGALVPNYVAVEPPELIGGYFCNIGRSRDSLRNSLSSNSDQQPSPSPMWRRSQVGKGCLNGYGSWCQGRTTGQWRD